MTNNQTILQATKMLKSQFLAQQADISNVTLSRCLHGGLNNGKPDQFTSQHIASIERAIHEIGGKLLLTKVERTPADEATQPYAYGETLLEKIKILGKVISIPYLFTECVGWSENKRKLHLNNRFEPKYYGVFSDEELSLINRSIRTIALSLCQMELSQNEQTSNIEIVMNKETRKKLNAHRTEIRSLVARCLSLKEQYTILGNDIKALASKVDCVQVDEQMKLDNMERFEGTERHERMEQSLDSISEANAYLSDADANEVKDALGFCKDYLQSALEALEDCGEPIEDALESADEYIKDAVES